MQDQPLVGLGAAALVSGLVLIGRAAFLGRRRAELSRWRRATARVVAVNVVRADNAADHRDGIRYAPVATYAYEVDGRRYEGRLLDTGVDPSGTPQGLARDIADELPPGRPVGIRYDPAAPERSHPDREEVGAPAPRLVAGVILVAAGVLCEFAAFG